MSVNLNLHVPVPNSVCVFLVFVCAYVCLCLYLCVYLWQPRSTSEFIFHSFVSLGVLYSLISLYFYFVDVLCELPCFCYYQGVRVQVAHDVIFERK